jgi:hypothetical protein
VNTCRGRISVVLKILSIILDEEGRTLGTEQNRTGREGNRGRARTRKMISRQNPICTNFNLEGETKIENCCARKYVKIA